MGLQNQNQVIICFTQQNINEILGRDIMNTTSMNRASSSSIRKNSKAKIVAMNVVQPKYFDIKTRQFKDIVD